MEELSIRELQARMSSAELSSVGITRFYLERIETIDQAGPKVNAVIEVNPDAAAVAAKRDNERKTRKLRGPLHGVPVMLKDNIDTRDRMQTTAGSIALEGSTVRRDAYIVRKLRASGAVILGKTNLSEWANFRGKRSVSGWSSRGGLTRNPYALDRTACGSSSGSAAAVAAGLCSVAVGTETDGSVICPSQSNGIVGIKPTLGLLSRSGIIPIAHSQDTAGTMGRSVEDAAILLGAMTGVDARDAATRPSGKRGVRNYLAYLDEGGLEGVRIGIARNMVGSYPRVHEILERSVAVMRELGAVIIDPADVPNFDQLTETEFEVLYFEFKAGLNRYLGARSAKTRVHSLQEVIQFNERNAERVMPYFGQEHMLRAAEKGTLSNKNYRKALSTNRRLSRKEGIDAALNKDRLNALVVASGGPAWTIDLLNGDARSWDMAITSPAAVAGYPHITVPAGYVSGMPVGISFFSTAWQEPTLIALAYAFEQATRVRRSPRFLSSAKIDETS